MIRIFSKDRQELRSDIDTWIVKWTTYECSFSGINYPKVKECYQAFTDKNEALDLRDRINEALKLIGITSLPYAVVKKQKRNSLD